MKLSTKEIAQALRTRALDFVESTSKQKQETVLVIDGFKIKCKPDRASIIAVAAKYEKARKYKQKVSDERYLPNTKNQTLTDLVYENDISAALQIFDDLVYAKTHQSPPLIILSVKKFSDGFVSGRCYNAQRDILGNWAITHLDTGAAVVHGETRPQAVKIFNSIDQHRITSKLKEFPGDFQHLARLELESLYCSWLTTAHAV